MQISFRQMHFVPVFVFISTLLHFVCGYNDGNILINPRKSSVFLQAFMNNAVQTGLLPIQQSDLANVISGLTSAVAAAREEATRSAFASVIKDTFGSDVNDKMNVILSALEKTYVQLGLQVDRSFIQDISSRIRYDTDTAVGVGINTGLEVGVNTGLGVGVETGLGVDVNTGLGVGVNNGLGVGVETGLGVGVNTGLGVGIDTGLGAGVDTSLGVGVDTAVGIGIGLGVQDQTNVGLAVGTSVGASVGADVDLAVDFKLRLLAGVKTANIFDGFSGAVSKKQLYITSRLLVEYLSNRFNLKLGYSYVSSCNKALSAADISLGLDAYLSVLADFTSQLLVQNGLLSDVDVALRLSIESIILACSKAFSLSIDTIAAIDIALSVAIDLGVGVGANVGLGVDVGLGDESDFKVGGGLDAEVLIEIAKRFGCFLKNSEEFDSSVLSKSVKSVLLSTIPAVGVSFGAKAVKALKHCYG